MTTRREPQLTGSRILVVEDETSIADVVARYLRRDGHEVETVADGATAIERFEETSPELIVLDLMCPASTARRCCGASVRPARRRS